MQKVCLAAYSDRDTQMSTEQILPKFSLKLVYMSISKYGAIARRAKEAIALENLIRSTDSEIFGSIYSSYSPAILNFFLIR